MFFDALHPGIENSTRVVLKIGGSILRRGETLLPVLEVVARARRPLVVVPGGGSFADAVREAQQRLGFSDRTAHQMAILALHQNALMIAERVPELRKLEAIEDIEHGLLQGQKLVWLPLRECEADAALPATWQATSDAIAARLACRLGGLPLVFMKSRSPQGHRNPANLASEELIDPVCTNILERSGSPFTIIEAGQPSVLAKLLGVDASVDAQPRA